MSDEIPLRCYFVATKGTRTRLASAVTLHAATRPRPLALVGAVLAVVAVVLVALHPDEAGRGLLLAVAITAVATLVELTRAWVAAYRSLSAYAVAGSRSQSGFGRDRFRVHTEAGDETHQFSYLAAIERRGLHVLVRNRADGQRWFVYPRALFPDAEVERIRAALGSRAERSAGAPAARRTRPEPRPVLRTAPPVTGGFNVVRPVVVDPPAPAAPTPPIDPVDPAVPSAPVDPVDPVVPDEVAPVEQARPVAPYRRPPVVEPAPVDLSARDISSRAVERPAPAEPARTPLTPAAPAPSASAPPGPRPSTPNERIEDVPLTRRFIAGPGTLEELTAAEAGLGWRATSTWAGPALLLVSVAALVGPVLGLGPALAVAVVVAGAALAVARRATTVRTRTALRAAYFPGAVLQAGFGVGSVRVRLPTGEHLVHHHALRSVLVVGTAVVVDAHGLGRTTLPRQLLDEAELTRLRAAVRR